MSKAPTTALSDLHGELATVLKEALRFRDEDGKPSAAILNVARQFLKDNKIEALPVRGSPLGELLDDLPEFDQDDESTSPNYQ